MNLLFICSQNRLRSPTAEALFAEHAIHTASSAGTDLDAVMPISSDLLEWADVVFPMESVHLRRLNQRFPTQMRHKSVVVLNIRDDYEYMDPELIERLRAKLRMHIEM
jgi:predicted protein tyrosine phosphatase